MSVQFLTGDVRAMLRKLPAESVHCVVTSPPYWGLRDYGVRGQIGLEASLGEHLAIMVDVFEEIRRVLRGDGTCWVNYGDCYATGRSAADTKAAGNDNRTYRDKPFSTIGPIFVASDQSRRRGRTGNLENGRGGHGPRHETLPNGRVVAGGVLKPKDLCMVANRLAIALQDAGWWVRSEIVWGKRSPMPDSSGRYRPSTAHEKIFMLTKSADHYYNAEAVALPCSLSTHARVSQNVAQQIGSARANGGGKTNGNMKAVIRTPKARADRSDGIKGNRSFYDATALITATRYLRNYEPAPAQVWEMATRGFKGAHFATFPPELAARCISAGCPVGGVVLDPFGGSGTTALVAHRLGRDSVLIDLNPKYTAMAKRRLKADGIVVDPDNGSRDRPRINKRTAAT